ncbi:hypothetical protein [Desulfovibrio sp. SGI.169]|uniref:hypothetical protein n=1 Tax=Desulfovibrio sp. SGI.169 TaxID=3420561 RepID=UPI003CFF5F89
MSDPNAAESLARLVQWLRERHDRIMAVEAEALRLLKAGDTPGHNAGMRKKAEMLAALHTDAAPLLAGLPGETRFRLALALERFSDSARTALKLNSVFYMSALLYPDTHKQGEPDNLTLCIDRMEQQGENFS